LTDVVFQDFPAEVFLQRPSIVKVCLYLIITVYCRFTIPRNQIVALFCLWSYFTNDLYTRTLSPDVVKLSQ